MCVCALVAAVEEEEGVAKTLKKKKKENLSVFTFVCARAAVPASVPSAMGTKTTVTTHSFP